MQTRKIVLIAAISFLSIGCNRQTPEEQVNQSKLLAENGNVKEAEIKLKNVISENAESLYARFVLGELYLESGLASAAEKEFKLTLDGKYRYEESLNFLLAALLYQNAFGEMIEVIQSNPSATSNVTKVYEAIALTNMGKQQEAKQLLEDTIDLETDSISTSLQSAILNDIDRKTDFAIEQLNAITPPDELKGLFFRYLGQLQLKNKDFAKAVESFKAYQAHLPNDNIASFVLADALVRNKEFAEAEKLLSKLSKIAPDNPYINKLKGVSAYNLKQYEPAKYAMEKVLDFEPNDYLANTIAGASSYMLGKFEQAHTHLVSANAVANKNEAVTRMLADVKVRLGYYEAAYETTSNLHSFKPEDKDLLLRLGLGLINAGEEEKVESTLKSLEPLVKNDGNALARLGTLKLYIDDPRGLVDLSLANELQKNDFTQAALIQGYIEEKEFEKASDVATKWVEVSPTSLDAQKWAARLALINNDYLLAQKHYKTLITIAPYNIEATNFLISKLLEDDKISEALNLYRDLVNNAKPLNTSTLQKYYLLEKAFGSESLGIDTLNRLTDNAPQNAQIRLAYAYALMDVGRSTDAREVLEAIEVDGSLPDAYWQLLAETYLVESKRQHADAIYKRWRIEEPSNFKAWVFPVALDLKEKDYSLAARNSEKALQRFPDNIALQLIKVEANLMQKNLREAEITFDRLPSKASQFSLYNKLKGNIDYARGNFESSETSLRKYYKFSPDSSTALLLANTLSRQNRETESFQFLEEHVRDHPNDDKVKLRLAVRYSEKNPSRAIALYTELNRKLSENYVIKNNLAWLYKNEGKLNDAIELAEEALSLKPDSTTILHTLTTIYMEKNDFNQANKYLEMLLKVEPNNEKALALLNELQNI